ncbi:hypothetical protein SRHO_G00205760 [Serrasalmus rhombeus]
MKEEQPWCFHGAARTTVEFAVQCVCLQSCPSDLSVAQKDLFAASPILFSEDRTVFHTVVVSSCVTAHLLMCIYSKSSLKINVAL